MRRHAAMAVLVLVAVAGCGSGGGKTSALRQYLRQQHQYGPDGYELLGTVTYSDGNVTVNAKPWADPWSGAETYCEWVSAWLYDDGNGTPDSRVTVNVPFRDVPGAAGNGPAKLIRRGLSEDCTEAALNSQQRG